MRNGNHDTTNGNVMIFRYLGNGGRLTVSGLTVSGEGMRGEGLANLQSDCHILMNFSGL
jgi:hypothetical protein